MEELLAKLKTRLRFDGTVEDGMLTYHLNLALDTVNDRRQFTPTDTELVESRYENIVIEMAVCSYNKMGAEGQTVHSENGVNRFYEGGFYPSSLMKMIIPKPRG